MSEKKKQSGTFYRKRKAREAAENEMQESILKKIIKIENIESREGLSTTVEGRFLTSENFKNDNITSCSNQEQKVPVNSTQQKPGLENSIDVHLISGRPDSQSTVLKIAVITSIFDCLPLHSRKWTRRLARVRGVEVAAVASELAVDSPYAVLLVVAARDAGVAVAVTEPAGTVLGAALPVVKEIAAKLDIKEEIPRVCRLQTVRNNVPGSTEEEYYRRAVYVPYLDDFWNSLKERFESHKETVTSLQHILPEFCTKTDFYSLEAAFDFYEEYLSHKEVMQSEFMSWKEKWSQEKSENLPKTAISSLEKCDKTFFPNIYILLKLLAVVPISVATVERSFSSLRILKTYLRNTTSESRVNGLALLSIHRDIKIRDEEVLDKFASVPRNLDFVL
ncbi:repressor of the inhibitor of the protein kinase [Araneus ventricosus]|uniref:Repressor of the inhibitor of the protein kinase n=1 Tax=Araneus ventricosus TaxID=182803 RepID=A0A4Y2HCH3_ARAVE|nr:repressor of the inhibitor of the protein kinase [Araneus ventricosus]